MTRITDEEFKASMHSLIRGHKLECSLPGGPLFILAENCEKRLNALKTRIDKTKSELRIKSWVEVLATPIAILVSTLLILGYLYLRK